MIDRSGFVPIRHPTLEFYYRVPVWVYNEKEGRTYTVSVGEYQTRNYDERTAPQKIKALVTMVDAFPYDPLDSMIDTLRGMSSVLGVGGSSLTTTAYVCPEPPQLEIGWRVTDTLYILVVEHEVLESMYITGRSDG